MKNLFLFILLLFLLTSGTLHAWHFVPPTGSGVANVKDYGAKGDGKTDDTEAILKAISDNIDKARYRANPFIWFPEGTYLVSDSIESRVIAEGRAEGKNFSAGWRSMMILIGETRDGTVIKLKDKAPGYADEENPKWVIATGSEHEDRNNQTGKGNRAFRHNILNLTVDVGNGNPGAIAIDFVASNRGSIDGVTIRAGKDSGHTAVALTRSWPGPSIIMDVSIEGFDHAFTMVHYQYGMTFENVTIRNTRKTAVLNARNLATMRKIDYSGSQPFYVGETRHSMLCLLDSKLTYTGSGKATAITSAGLLNLRRIAFKNFSTIVDDTNKPNRDLTAADLEGDVLRNYDQGPTVDVGGGEPDHLDLPIEEIPTVRPPDDAEWTSAGDTGASLQKAIDSGAEYIFIKPVFALKCAEPVILRGNVKLIMGMHGQIVGPDDGRPVIEMGEGKPDTVCLEHLHISGGPILHSSDRTLIIRHSDIHQGGYLATGKGKTHVIDVIGRGYKIGEHHKFWARQLNAEFGADPLFTNSGTSVILGFKMESSSAGSKSAPLSTPSLLNHSGQLEVIGGFLYTLGNGPSAAPKVPAFTNTAGTIAVSYRLNGKPSTYYPVILREGTLEKGTDFPSEIIKGAGAALLRSTK